MSLLIINTGFFICCIVLKERLLFLFMHSKEILFFKKRVSVSFVRAPFVSSSKTIVFASTGVS